MNKKVFLIVAICIVLFLIFVKFFVNCMYPNRYSEYVEKYADEYDVDSKLIYAIIKQESNFKPNVNSSKGAIGLMQLMNSTANEVAQKLECFDFNLYSPEVNIRFGVKHLSDLLLKYDNNTDMAIVAYNAGMGNVDNWIKNGIINEDGTNLENIPYRETNMYLRKVLKNYEIYSKLY